jgi:hypothetical protein
MKILPLILSVLLFTGLHAFATTYFVDYEGGSDDADGTTPTTAWMHSPGDKNAAGTPQNIKLQPGDVVHFRGGVQYLGEIDLKDSGSEGKPIIFDGNTNGKFGAGPAILDGAKMITDWQPVTSAEEVGGNLNWQKIMYADLDVDLTSNFNQDKFILHRDTNKNRQAPWQRLFLIDGEKRVLPIAQRPKPEDPFYPDLPGGFFKSPVKMTNSYPHQVSYEKGTRGNSSLPLIAITYGGSAPVIEPFNGGAVSVKMDQPESIAEIGFTLFRPKSQIQPEQIVFFADDQEVYTAQVDPKDAAMQRFKLPKTVKASKLTFELRHSGSKIPKWIKFQQIAAFTPNGDNIVEHQLSTVIEDQERFIQQDPLWYDDAFVGVHGGNNHVYFARVNQYDPDTRQLQVPHFSAAIYNQTKYALFNSPKLIDLPGEWCLMPLEGGKTRVFFMPETLKDGQPVNIGYPFLRTAISVNGAVSHLEIRGFLMQRYAGGKGGVAINGKAGDRPSNILISDCEIRFMSGQSGISLNHSDHIKVENCYVHHCPGWTVGIYVNRINHYQLIGNRVDNNSGSGIRHYEAKHGLLENNVVINHYGMHSSGLNFYEGCADILFTGNYVQNVIAINRSAEDLTFRNNVVDSQNRNAVSVSMWLSGTVGGTFIKNLTFENNTFINVRPSTEWATAIFVQRNASAPTGVVAKNNVLDRLKTPFPGTIEDNIFMRETEEKVAGSGSMVVSDPNELFMNPAEGDFRRKPGGPMMEAGANVPPPPATWQR